MIFNKRLVWLILLFSQILATNANELCPGPKLDDNMNLIIPCVGVNGQQYSANLAFITDSQPELFWKLDQATLDSSCQWNPNTCLSLDAQLNLILPNINVDGLDYTVSLQNVSNENEIAWQYHNHGLRQARSYSPSRGTFAPYAKPQPVNGTGRKLLAIYMVGSDLEAFYRNATKDLKELIDGYNSLEEAEKIVDVVIAFGGAKRDNWRGMKFANLAQIIADNGDGVFGNLDNYLYSDERAHMGDASSLELFLNYLKEGYINYDQQFLVFWNHGGSYKGIGFDQYYEMDPLSLDEVQSSLNNTNSRFNLIGFDACLMASVETANYTYKYADYLLASEELEPGHGWNWTDVLIQYARSTDVVDMAKKVIDNYVKDESHARKSSGKTLSIVDLSHFEPIKNLTDAFLNELILHSREELSLLFSTGMATKESRNYGEETSVDLYDLAINIIARINKTSVKEKADILLDGLDKYIVHSRHDGTRPNSYGVSINKIDNEPTNISISPAIDSLQRMWKNSTKNDATPPSVSGQQNNVNAADAQICKDVIDQQYLSALKDLIDGVVLTEASKEILKPLASNPTPEQRNFLLLAYNILSNDNLSFNEKLADIENLENQPGYPYPSGSISRGVRAYSEISRGVRAATACATDDRGVRSGFRNELVRLNLHGENSMFTHQANRTRLTRTKFAGIFGMVSSFSDDQSGVKVSTIYGRVETDAKTGQQYFKTVAELEAYPTETGYFTPAWNRIWYNVTYDPNKRSEWIPMVFEYHYRKDGQTYTVYSVKVQYRNSEINYPEDNTNHFEFGNLEIHVDANNKVVFHEITPHAMLQDHQGKSLIVPAKLSAHLKAGDELRFLYEAISLIPGNPSKINSTTDDDFIIFTQEPEFGVELLVFADLDPNSPSPIKEYSYAMRAKDSAGKSVITEPVIAPVEMPSCDKLTETLVGLNDAYDHVSKGGKISLNTPIGANFDEAMATLISVGETWVNPEFTNNFYTLFRMLYNLNTRSIDSHSDSSNWVWDNIDFNDVKIKIDAILPDFEIIHEAQCSVSRGVR